MAMGTFLSQAEQTRSRDGAMVIYPLYKTLTEAGSVSRGVCTIHEGRLLSITEHTKIEQSDGRIVSHQEASQDVELTPETGVSMNFWGLPPQAFADLTDYFTDFIKAHGKDPKKECYLPSAIDYLIHHRGLVIHALETPAQWFGVTYREDRERAMERIRALVAAGVYPGLLWV
jgi:hypothetical protein